MFWNETSTNLSFKCDRLSYKRFNVFIWAAFISLSVFFQEGVLGWVYIYLVVCRSVCQSACLSVHWLICMNMVGKLLGNWIPLNDFCCFACWPTIPSAAVAIVILAVVVVTTTTGVGKFWDRCCQHVWKLKVCRNTWAIIEQGSVALCRTCLKKKKYPNFHWRWNFHLGHHRFLISIRNSIVNILNFRNHKNSSIELTNLGFVVGWADHVPT